MNVFKALGRDWKRFPHQRYPDDLVSYFFALPQKGIVHKTTPIGSMGSCFAAYISKYLIASGYNYVITQEPRYDTFSAQWGIVVSPPCLFQIFQYSLTDRFNPEEKYWVYENEKFDPYRRGFYYDEVSFENHRIKSREAIVQSDIFIITLGLTEVWRDRRDGSVFAVAPPRMEPYYEFYTLTKDDVVSCLQGIYNLFKCANPRGQLILTVSPIPLVATFRTDVDVVTANCDSKATLRVAAGEFCRALPDVFYFPSYEFIISGMPFFLEDNRHPKPEVVTRMMEFFLHLYGGK